MLEIQLTTISHQFNNFHSSFNCHFEPSQSDQPFLDVDTMLRCLQGRRSATDGLERTPVGKNAGFILALATAGKDARTIVSNASLLRHSGIQVSERRRSENTEVRFFRVFPLRSRPDPRGRIQAQTTGTCLLLGQGKHYRASRSRRKKTPLVSVVSVRSRKMVACRWLSLFVRFYDFYGGCTGLMQKEMPISQKKLYFPGSHDLSEGLLDNHVFFYH